MIVVRERTMRGMKVTHPKLRKAGFVVHMASFHDSYESVVFIDNEVLDVEETRLYLQRLRRENNER